MSNIDEAITYIFKWNALSDACPKCRSLNAREYQKDQIYNDIVWDGQWGNIWNLSVGHSLAHPNCRCQLALRVETRPCTIQDALEQLLFALTSLRQKLERI